MKQPFVTLILAGGKGTRMGSTEKHKVCFEVGGVPVILRALETYDLCGSRCNLLVVGAMAESVMATVGTRFHGAIFAFQPKPLGTGDAARKGAEILERMHFEGDVLVVAGDKLIEPRVIRQLLATHASKKADVTLVTARRPTGSNTGILLTNRQGRIVGILEEAERQRLLGLAILDQALRSKGSLPQAEVLNLFSAHLSEKNSHKVVAELWSGLEPGAALSRSEFGRRTTADERRGVLNTGGVVVPASQILEQFTQMNLSTYVFRAPILFEALRRLRSSRPTQEEYLTDVFELFAQDQPPAQVIGCEVENPEDIMAFNNPQELLAMEESFQRKTRGPDAAALQPPDGSLAVISEWEGLLQDPSPAARRQFRQWYGPDVPWSSMRSVVRAFADRFGAGQPAVIIRSPGRINLLGRHIDHQGGPVNVLAINREIYLVASPRSDDLVTLANTAPALFPERSFRISELVANLDWEDWQQVVDGPRLRYLLETARGDWGTYVKAALLRLQEQFRDRRLRGLDIMVGGDVPMGAGLSSSSALVVAAAEAASVLNRLPVTARQLVSLCGEGEWFVGTRGGAADHAAIRLSRRGQVTQVGFFPFAIQDSAPFFPDHELIVCNSGLFAGKSAAVRQVFNEKVTAYHLGRILFKLARPELAPRLEHLRDLTPERLQLDRPTFHRLLQQLPVRLPRAKAVAGFSAMSSEDRDRLERLFATHAAPAGGYPVRDVVLFGLSEMARARRCLDLLRAGDAIGLGRLMNRSHDGDRVSRPTAKGGRQRLAATVTDPDFEAWVGGNGQGGDMAELAGAYACSLPQLDHIADLAMTLPGVRGAQLAGAGLGGCVMLLAQTEHTPAVLAALAQAGTQASAFKPIAGASRLVMR